ncbi:MAG TPA: Na+/H+ antiporter [Burkholderiales bacterium]|nr:Na+/H+ antiporter [Burkholderiales bacterium]
MEYLEIALALLCAVAALGALSKRVAIPLPILQMAGGVAISFVPGFADIRIDPPLFFALFIPPLLFSEGWRIPKRDFFRVMRPVLLLALGLVALTILVVGYLVHVLIPGVPLAAAFALGAIISPTDAVAVSAITRKLQIPDRITHVIKGESLINDASGLVAFKFAVAAVLTGAFSLQRAALSFLVLSLGGAIVGLAVAWIVGGLRLWLLRRESSEPIIQTTLSLLTPFAAYFAAEQLHVSGILAVVVAGVYAGIHDTRNLATETRLQTWEVWTMLLFAFNGLVFVLLGLQLRGVIAGLAGHSWRELAAYAAILSATVIVLRIAWVFIGAYLPRWLFRKVREREEPLHPADVFIVGWSGIRGSITLAAALSLPFLAAAGQFFPERNLLIYLAGSVIVITLLVHGLTLPLLIRWFKIVGDGIAEREENMARIAVAEAAIRQIRQHAIAPHEHVFAARLIASYERKIQHLAAAKKDRGDFETRVNAESSLCFDALSAEREELFRLQQNQSINEEVLRTIQREIDYAESSLLGSIEGRP